jgi:hypothetical protein
MLLACDFGETLQEVRACIRVEVNTLQPDDIREYVVLRPATDAAEILQRLAAGHVCFNARTEERLIHACWVATDRATVAYLSREIQLDRIRCTPTIFSPYTSFAAATWPSS